jgi:hypothetical protein
VHAISRLEDFQSIIKIFPVLITIMSISKKFSVVEFLVDQSIEYIPSKWLNDDNTTCFWPEKPPGSFKKIRKNSESSASTSWRKFSIKVLKQHGKKMF